MTDVEVVVLDDETSAMLDALRLQDARLPIDFSVSDEGDVTIDVETHYKLWAIALHEDDDPDNSEMVRRLIHRAHRRMQNRLM